MPLFREQHKKFVLALLGFSITNVAKAQQFMSQEYAVPSTPNLRLQASHEQVRDYQKELEERQSNPFYDSTVGGLNELGQRQNPSKKELNNLTTESYEPNQNKIDMATFQETKESREADEEHVFQYLASEAQDLIADKANRIISPIFDTRNGLSFSFDFTSSSNSPSQNRNAHRSDNIKYDVVVTKVKRKRKGPYLASTQGERSSYQFAVPGEVIYSIGPVQDANVPYLPVQNSSATSQEFSWRSYVPSPKFQTSVTPIDFENIATDGKVGYNVKVKQSEGLYEHRYTVKPQEEPPTQEHDINIPMSGVCTISRTFDENFKTKSTSLKNIRYQDGSPTMNLHYFNETQRYQADTSVEIDSYQLDFEYRTEANELESDPNERPERYKVGVTKPF